MYLRKQQMSLARLMFAAGILLFLLSGGFWLEKVYGSATNTFWGMVEGNLKTTGQAQSAVQGDASQGLIQDQNIQVELGAQAIAAATTKIAQNPNTEQQVKIDNETISTPTTNYVRYTDIDIRQKLPNGNMPDFTKAENVWAQEPNSGSGRSSLINAMFGSLGRMPVGNLNPKQRQELVRTMQDNKVYTINSANTKKEYRGIRPAITYDISVNVQQYVFMLKKFDEMSGMNQLKSVDPTQFPEGEKIKLKATVDVLSRNLLSVTYVSNKQTENFGGFGSYISINAPSNAVSLQELDTQLQAILSGQQ